MTAGELLVIFGLQPQGWEKGNKLVEGLARAARRYIGVEAIHHVAEFVNHTTEAATHLISMSKAMGLTIQQTQEWGYVAEQSGSNLTRLSIGMNMFARNLREYAQGRGGKTTASYMREIGMSVEDARKSLASPDGLNNALLKMSDRLKAMGDTPERAALVARAFGARAGRDMLADLARGSAGLKELMERRRAMGELSDGQAFGLRDLGNRIKDLKTSLGALGAIVLGTMAPALTKMAEAAGKWIRENRDLISGALLGAFKAIAVVVQVIGGAIAWLGGVIRDALGGDKGAIAICMGLAAAILSIVIPALYSMAVAAWASLGPYALIAAAVAAIAYVALKYGPEIAKALGDAGSWAKRKFAEFTDYVSSIPDKIRDAFTSAGEAIKHKLQAAFDAVVAAAKHAWHEIRNLPIIKQVVDVGEGVASNVRDLANGRNRVNDWLNTEMANRGISMPGAAATVNVPGGSSQHVEVNVNVGDIKVDGSKDPKATASGIAQHLDQQVRHAWRATGGELR